MGPWPRTVSGFGFNLVVGDDDTWAAPKRGRWLLWDLENCPAATGRARQLWFTMLDAAGPFDRAIAAGQDAVIGRYVSELVNLGITFLTAPAVKDGADQLLLGVVDGEPQLDLVVASNDWQFVMLARRGHQLTVLTQRPEQVSRALIAVAEAVLEIPSPGSRIGPRGASEWSAGQALRGRAVAGELPPLPADRNGSFISK